MASKTTRKLAGSALEVVWSSFRDLLPIILVVAFFQAFIFQQWPEDLPQLLIGTFLVVGGLSLFVAGLQMALFPIGESMANDFALKGSMPWMLVFAFALGFGTTFAEPALIAIGDKAAELRFQASEYADDQSAHRGRFSFVLRATVAFSVGLALLIGVIRIIKGWPIQYLIIPGYVLIMLATPLAPKDMVAIAYDSGGVTTSTITVPLTTALGVGLASSIRGRNPMLDGFGLIALASLTPILFVLLMGIVWQ